MKKTYYYCPLDGFGQPNGDVQRIELTEEEYAAIKKDVFSPYYYCYESYSDASRRALD